MSTWSVQDAKARFSKMLEACLHEGPQLISRRGTAAAVILPIEEWQRLTEAAQPRLKDLLLSPAPRGRLQIPARGRLRRHAPPEAGA